MVKATRLPNGNLPHPRAGGGLAARSTLPIMVGKLMGAVAEVLEAISSRLART